MLNKEKLNANAVGVAAHTDPQTKRHNINCPNNHNSTKLLVPRNGRRREKK